MENCEVFKAFIGATLQSLTFAQYQFNGESCGNDIGSLELEFDASRFLLLSLASDGETVIASHDRLVIQPGFTLEGGGRCEWLRTECGNDFVGDRLLAVDAQIDRIGNSAPFPSGWILRFETGFIGYHNFGDDAYILYNESAPQCENVTTIIERIAGQIIG